MKLNYQHVLKFHLNQKNQSYLKSLNYEMFLKDQLHRLYPRMLNYLLNLRLLNYLNYLIKHLNLVNLKSQNHLKSQNYLIDHLYLLHQMYPKSLMKLSYLMYQKKQKYLIHHLNH